MNNPGGGRFRPSKLPRRSSPLGAAIVLGLAVVVLVGLGAALGVGRPASSPAPGVAAGGSTSGAITSAPATTGSPLPAASSPSLAPTAAAIGPVPIVPVVSYRSGASSVDASTVAATLAGRGDWKAIELVAGDADAALATLGVTRAVAGARLVTAPDAATLMKDLAAHRDRLAFLRADEVGPGIRALAWKGVELFGVHHLKSLAAWPLTATLPLALPGVPAYDPATTWTLWAAGDLGLDRTVAYVVSVLGKGVDYPYDGGTAKIARIVCCSPFGWKVPVIVSTGNRGAMRDLISSADIALANMEESAPDRFTFHRHGTVFTGNPALLAGVARAGIDVASCASTHIGDGGRAGILQTVASMKRYGIAAFGCGVNLAAARRPAMFTIDGTTVAILGYDGISAKYYGATATTIGDAPLDGDYIKADVAAARAAGAQVVIVYPHWGTEYTFGPTALQQRLAHLAIDAGADIVIGNHPHWVQSVEVYKGKPIWYALGNFTFDQSWSEPTLEGISLELTFRGPTLVQARMIPHILVDSVQPNLLDPAGDGRRVLDPVFNASGSLFPW